MSGVIKKVFNRLFSTGAAGLYMVLFALSIGTATFIENDFGTSSAQKIVYRSGWFELLLLLFAISIIVNIFRFRMIQQKKWATLTFHCAAIIILTGSAITRFTSFEGMMHIREGSASSKFQSTEPYLKFQVRKGGQTYQFDEKVFFASLGRNHFDESYQLGNDLLHVQLTGFVPNPKKYFEASPDGVPIVKIVMGGQQGRQEYFLRQGDVVNLNGVVFNFDNAEQPQAINIMLQGDSLLFKPPMPMSLMQMATQRRDSVIVGTYQPLLLRTLYSNPAISFVVGDYTPSGKVMMTSESPKMKNESVAAVGLQISSGDDAEQVFVYGNKGSEGTPVSTHVGDMDVTVAYGSRYVQLPFAIQLHDFIMDRYPGTNSASSYASQVTLVDPRHGVNRDFRIYMNHILNYDGYRFFQSSYDQDEQGTVLSVNHDMWGTRVSYLGYFLLTLGMVLTLLGRKSRVHELSQKLKSMRKGAAKASPAYGIALFLLLGGSALHAKSVNEFSVPAIDPQHAEEFGRVTVQDYKGRMKPMNTLCSEVLRKIARKESLYGQTPDQVILGMIVYPEQWMSVPLIKAGSFEEIRKLLNAGNEDLVPFDAFFTAGGQYVLKDLVRRAYSLQPADRTMLDKDLMRIDERVNICNMIFTGDMLNIFPVSPDNDTWLSPYSVTHPKDSVALNTFVQKFFPAYVPTVRDAMDSGDWSLANELIQDLGIYQHKMGGDLVPSQKKIDLEILLNKSDIFSRLGKYYGLLGLLFLVLFFIQVFNHRLDMKWPVRISFGLMAACFLMHTTGLGIRWYVSGRAPWSNGYESMIYIAWTTTLAGLIFGRKSLGGLAATAVLASTILMVAMLSYLDPEITPLVPVLRSYWLTIHVSMEAGSYGFLMLGAIIGVLNLILMALLNRKNLSRVMRTIKELSWISEMTLIGGLCMVSTGTYLGGVWANESWGRYWGWDAKETWALVTVLVYAFILHMRFIPGLRGFFAFNVASLFGFATVMMTYFGVNYYLSGLHSYAAGDPIPVPAAVYYTSASFLTLSLLAMWRWRKKDNFIGNK